MAAPDLDSFAQRTYDEVEPMRTLDALNGYALAHYLAAIGTLFQEIEDYAADGPNGEVGWSGVLDLDRSPDKGLDWLGQFVGVLPRGGLNSVEHRQRIANHEQWERGTPGAMIKAVALHLTGSKRVVLYERDTSSYHFNVTSFLAETPVGDWPSTNLVANGGGETNTTGWTASNCTLSSSTEQAMFGSRSIKAVATAANPLPFYDVAISGATAGRVFTNSIYIYAPAGMIGKTMTIQLWELGGAQAQDAVGASFVPTQVGWQRLSVSKTIVQNDRTSLRINAGFTGGAVSGDIFYLDGAQIEERPQATPYIETDGAIVSRPAGAGGILAEILQQKPAGLVVSYLVSSGQDYLNVFVSYASYQAVLNAFATYANLLNNTPSGGATTRSFATGTYSSGTYGST